MATRKPRHRDEDGTASEAHRPARRRRKETVEEQTKQHVADVSEEGAQGNGAAPEARPRANGATPGEALRTEPAPSGMTDDGADGSATHRAEEVVDRIAEKVANFTSLFGRQLLRLGARVREEAEDMWAEAQSIRRGDKP
jgi:hypothetical protein